MRNFVSEAIFEVAPFREPYYNPVNLENACTCVKEKESIQRIAGSAPHAADQRSGASSRNFFFGAAGVGTTWPGRSAAHQEPLSFVQRSGCAPAATRAFSSTRSRAESCRNRACVEAPRGSRSSRRSRHTSWPAFSAAADTSRAFACAGGARHGRLGRVSQLAGTRTNALFGGHVAAHCALLSHEHSFALRNGRRESSAGTAWATKNSRDQCGRADGTPRLGQHSDGAASVPHKAAWRQRRILLSRGRGIPA